MILEKALESVVKKVVKGQKESDELFMDLEVKHMKMEERMLELETQWYQEDRARTEHQHRVEREFQLKLCAMICGSGSSVYNSPQSLGPLPQPCPPLPMSHAYQFPLGYPGASTLCSSHSGSFIGELEYEEEC